MTVRRSNYNWLVEGRVGDVQEYFGAILQQKHISHKFHRKLNRNDLRSWETFGGQRRLSTH